MEQGTNVTVFCQSWKMLYLYISLIFKSIYALSMMRWVNNSVTLFVSYYPIHMKCSAVKGFRKKTISQWAEKSLATGTHVISDGLSAFKGIDEAGFEHEAIITGGGATSKEILALHWVNIILGNLKNSIHGTYHALNGKHLPRYLAEFNYRFNRRFKLEQLVNQLLRDAARTAPMPERLIKLAEVAW